MTSMTGALAVDIAGDKDLTTKLLASAGLPVPRSEAVRSVDAAVSANTASADRIERTVVRSGSNPNAAPLLVTWLIRIHSPTTSTDAPAARLDSTAILVTRSSRKTSTATAATRAMRRGVTS